MPNDRELAALIWLLALLLWMLSVTPIRASMLLVVRRLLSRPVFPAVVILVGWIASMVWLGSQVGIWNFDLTTKTLFWFGGTGVLLFLNVDRAYKEENFFSRTVSETVGYSTLLAFVVNFFVLHLVLELFLQAIIALLVMIEVVASREAKFRQVKLACDFLLATIGFSLIGYGAANLITGWGSIVWIDAALGFSLPIWMTTGLLPYIYLLTLYISYEKRMLSNSL